MSVFAKPSSEWTESDIQILIDQEVEESLNLDYKESAALQKHDKQKNDISKDVSAFANSAGGIIVYGVVETKNYLPERIDSGVSRHEISKEWIESVILSRIRPRIDGVRINQVRLASGEDRVLYIVDIPQATYSAPHQASDYRYYKRFNFQSVPMEDYEIQDVRRRAVGPDIHTNLIDVEREWNGGEEILHFNISIVNRSGEPALYANFDLYLDQGLDLFSRPVGSHDPERVECTINGAACSMVRFSCPWITPDQPPIWDGLEQRLSPYPLRSHTSGLSSGYLVVVGVSAPYMSQRFTGFQVTPSRSSDSIEVVDLTECRFSLTHVAPRYP
jgi:hypothetical protein